ncbi:MAG: hypothetical protein CL892_03280 [Dehalococcoidia bacterium]|nr:hypothetical protein [Dehalococcoidia bacterium]
MNIFEELKSLEKLINESGSLIPGKGLDKPRAIEIINQVIASLPTELDEAGMVTRQKEAIIDQADKEATRIRNYADEEASTMREIAKRDAAEIISEAEKKAEEMIMETSIVDGANRKSEEIVSEAQAESERIILNAQQESARMLDESEQISTDRRDGADNYAKEVLYALEERISTILSQVRSGLDLLDDPNESENENITMEQNQ